MEIIKTDIEDLILIKPRVIEDDRGYFMEAYKHDWFFNDEMKIEFIQENESSSEYGVLRGLHFQNPPFEQSKLVRVLKGEVLDVVVDLRKKSITYGQHRTFILSEEDKKYLFIPRGFAHGFVVLSKNAVFTYKVDNQYSPECESGILWNDLVLDIDWIVPEEDIKTSEKDKKLPIFDDFISKF